MGAVKRIACTMLGFVVLVVRNVVFGLGVGLGVLFFALTAPEAGGSGFDGTEAWWAPFVGALLLAGVIAVVLIVRPSQAHQAVGAPEREKDAQGGRARTRDARVPRPTTA